MPLARLRFACVLALLPLLACMTETVPVSASYDPLERFPAAATYVWDDTANALPDDPKVDRQQIDALIHEVADQAFAAHGYTRVASGDANYRLSYQYRINEYISADVSRAYGSLSLQLAEGSSGRRVWLGFGRAQIHVGLTLEERRARLLDAMTRMLEDFPPTQRPAE